MMISLGFDNEPLNGFRFVSTLPAQTSSASSDDAWTDYFYSHPHPEVAVTIGSKTYRVGDAGLILRPAQQTAFLSGPALDEVYCDLTLLSALEGQRPTIPLRDFYLLCRTFYRWSEQPCIGEFLGGAVAAGLRFDFVGGIPVEHPWACVNRRWLANFRKAVQARKDFYSCQ